MASIESELCSFSFFCACRSSSSPPGSSESRAQRTIRSEMLRASDGRCVGVAPIELSERSSSPSVFLVFRHWTSAFGLRVVASRLGLQPADTSLQCGILFCFYAGSGGCCFRLGDRRPIGTLRVPRVQAPRRAIAKRATAARRGSPHQPPAEPARVSGGRIRAGRPSGMGGSPQLGRTRLLGRLSGKVGRCRRISRKTQITDTFEAPRSLERRPGATPPTPASITTAGSARRQSGELPAVRFFSVSRFAIQHLAYQQADFYGPRNCGVILVSHRNTERHYCVPRSASASNLLREQRGRGQQLRERRNFRSSFARH
jgi:hypothetical protein